MADENATCEEQLPTEDQMIGEEASAGSSVEASFGDAGELVPGDDEGTKLVEAAEGLDEETSEGVVENRIIVDEPENPEKPQVSTTDKVKGAAKMAAGAALAAAAVPAILIPVSPTTLMVVGGTTIAARGQRQFSGREISKFEEKAEAATEKLTDVTKKTTGGLLSKLGKACESGAKKLNEMDLDEKWGK